MPYTIIDPPVPTPEDPNIRYTGYTQVKLPTTDFILIATPGESYIIKNSSGSPVYVAMNDNGEELSGSSTQYCIGGTTYEIQTNVLKFTWIRASVVDTVISIRRYTDIDPTKDLPSLIAFANDIAYELAQHRADTKNADHKVNQDQVGLSNLPNAITSEPDVGSEDILATAMAVSIVNARILEHASNTTANPHKVNKGDVKLGNVQNFGIVDINKPSDLESTVNNLYVTPASAYKIIQAASDIDRSAGPQLILEGNVGTIPDGWIDGECSLPTETIVKDSAYILKVKKGLRVSLGNDYKIMVTESLATDMPITIPSTDGTYYIYVDATAGSIINSCNYTTVPPVYGVYDEGAPGDFFNFATCQMFDGERTAIRRVYIGKVVVANSAISSIVCVPIGNRYVAPIKTQLSLSERHLLVNPFMTKHLKTTAEVLYNESFSATGWNDQIGVTAHVHPAQPTDLVVVQCGKMGFLSSGRESGCAFGSTFTTITTPLRSRVVMERVLF